jgi:hypothetical protein
LDEVTMSPQPLATLQVKVPTFTPCGAAYAEVTLVAPAQAIMVVAASNMLILFNIIFSLENAGASFRRN